jgi:histidine triad (HIT) family protein
LTACAQAGCDFCEIIARDEPARVVLRNERVVAFFPIEPATLGHTLVVPAMHIPNIWSLDQRIAHDLCDATLRVAGAIREALVPEGLNIIQSNGEAASQTVMHLHIHVVPRSRNDEMGAIWPEKTTFTDQAKDDAYLRIREAMRL